MVRLSDSYDANRIIPTDEKPGIRSDVVTEPTGNTRHDASPSDEEIVNQAKAGGWLTSVTLIERTPDWQSPVYDIVYGTGTDGTARVCLLHYPEDGSSVRVLDSFPQADMLTLKAACDLLKDAGHPVPETGVDAILTPVGTDALAWQISWEEAKGEESVYIRYQLNVKSGVILEEYRFPEATTNE